MIGFWQAFIYVWLMGCNAEASSNGRDRCLLLYGDNHLTLQPVYVPGWGTEIFSFPVVVKNFSDSKDFVSPPNKNGWSVK